MSCGSNSLQLVHSSSSLCLRAQPSASSFSLCLRLRVQTVYFLYLYISHRVTHLTFEGFHRDGEASLGVNGPTRCPRSSRTLNLGVSGHCGSSGARAARAADGTPRLSCLSHWGRVCVIRGAFHRNPRVAGPRKDGTRDALRQRGSLGL